MGPIYSDVLLSVTRHCAQCMLVAIRLSLLLMMLWICMKLQPQYVLSIMLLSMYPLMYTIFTVTFNRQLLCVVYLVVVITSLTYCDLQGAYRSWKVMEFKIQTFQA